MPPGPKKSSGPRFVLPSSRYDLETPVPRKRFAVALQSGRPQPSLSGSGSSPRFNKPTYSQKDDGEHNSNAIQDPGSSPPLPSSRSFSSSLKANHAEENVSRFHNDPLSDDEEITDQFRFSVRSQGANGRQQDSMYDSARDDDDINGRAADSRKRRRIDSGHDAIWLSSSSPSSPTRVGSSENDGQPEERPSSSPLLSSPTMTGRSLPRFRYPDQITSDNDYVPVSRPSFRLPAATSTGHNTEITLPEAFSPSRRRGKGKDYITGGMADTMRSWIVGLSAEDHGHTSHATGDARRLYGRTARIVALEQDADRRCSIVRCDDGAVIMLAGNGGSHQVQQIRVGSLIGIKQGRMLWGFESGALLGEGSSARIEVSISWDVLQL
ncbi:MAG: hypothetical protein Q9227_001341 [Pyrenula ochraceoflavens]